jgi:Mn-dependent DtxR family transcriptional regulator
MKKDVLVLSREFLDAIMSGKNSRVSIQLAIYLVNIIGFTEFKKLPQRKKMAEYLDVTHQTVLDSLRQLIDNNVLIPDESYNGRFAGKFKLNSCNTSEEYTKLVRLHELINDPNKTKGDIVKTIVDEF